MAKSKKRFQMSDDHKEALAQGREQGRAVRNYLAALEQDQRRGRRRDPAELERRIEELQGQIDLESDPTRRLELVQKRFDLSDQLADSGDAHDLEALEADFVANAASYGERKGISYHAWREIGVPAAVLKQAGVARTRRS